MDLAIVVICCIAISLLSLVVLVRNPTKLDNRLFAAISFALVLWSVFNYLSDNATATNLLYTRLTFIAGTLSIFAFISLAINYPARVKLRGSPLIHIYGIATAILLPIMLTPLFIEDVSEKIVDHGVIYTGSLYPVFIIYVAYSVLLLLLSWLQQRASAKIPIERQQVTLLYSGIALFGVLALLSNVIIPLVFDNWLSSRFGPLFSLLFVAIIARAIATKKLFDVHLFAVRAAMYISTSFLLGIFCVAPLILIFGYFLDYHPPVTEFVVLTLLSVIASYILQYVRLIFDRMTKKVFYHNYYEPQDVLEELSDILVRTPEIDTLCTKSSHLLAEVLQAHSATYFLLESSKEQDRKLLKTMLKDSSNILVTDDLMQSNRNLGEKLKELKVAIAVKLRTRHEDLGYLMLGYKQSGELYNSRDLQLLSTAADEIAISLQNALRRKEIEQFNIFLQQRVEDATRKLRESNKKLKQLNDSKDDFIGMTSHQLRTPLTSIKGYVSLVMDGDAGRINAKQKELLQQAFNSSQKMVYLVSDLLNVSRLKTGKFVIERSPVNLAKLIADEMDQLKAEAASRGLELTYEAPQEFPILPLDETKTRQVIMNFLDNAIYYTPKGGHILAKLEELPHSVEFRVVDDGIGVPKQERHQLFTKFYRAKNAQRARPDGTGLGLYMARKVVTTQGGALIFDSVEGKGSTFGFTFPKDMPSEPVALPAQTRD